MHLQVADGYRRKNPMFFMPYKTLCLIRVKIIKIKFIRYLFWVIINILLQYYHKMTFKSKILKYLLSYPLI